MASSPTFDVHVDYLERDVHVRGEFDLAAVARFAAAVALLQRRDEGDITIRLENVTFIDASGLGAVVGAYVSVRERGNRVKLAGITPSVLRAGGRQSRDLERVG